MSTGKKHYVLLEYLPENPQQVVGIPWPELLAGAAQVTNWKHVNKDTLDEIALNAGVGQVFCNLGGLTETQLMDYLVGDENNNDDIVLHESYEGLTIPELVQTVEEMGDGILYEVMNVLQIDKETRHE